MKNASSIIFLLGFMGSGKTKTGKRAAKLLSYDFIDLDKHIQQKEDLSIQEIFEQKGEEYFRKKETEYLYQLTVETDYYPSQPEHNRETDNNPSLRGNQPQKGSKPFRGLIISVGGGTPCFNNNMAWMLQHGKCIWLKVTEEELFNRLKDKREKRPLLRNLTDDGLKEFIRKKLEERSPFYSQADLIINADGLKAEELAEKIKSV